MSGVSSLLKPVNRSEGLHGEMSELAEGARLEIVCAVKSGTEGSNPSLSAIRFLVLKHNPEYPPPSLPPSFRTYTNWVTKGKAGVPFESGLNVCACGQNNAVL